MKITAIVVGRAKAPLRDAIADYETRAGRYWKLEVVEVASGGGAKGKSRPDRVVETEEALLLARLPERAQVVALTRTGHGLKSVDLAAYLDDHALHSTQDVCFIIGGAFGLGPRILDRAQKRWSLSESTLPHEMARLLLAEQLYRAGTIIRNEPYHKGPSRGDHRGSH
ncbi:MAG TPA: 23S rRNA (pseudouridine(1915)-N(3))-methyltransferase RlmH [Gemmatimonadetes bacterium]|nr:23S rRNA (pseudouridine(1915)-N(3))-methyltransferase RlmH [Gemmatimonadota bacterium]